MKTYVSQLSATDSFYLGEAQDGAILIRHDTGNNLLIESPHYRLSPTMAVALALTERCCSLGAGMVFYFASAALKFPQAMGAKITGLGEITNKLLASPDLVYMACEWSEAEKTAWLSKQHDERLYRLNAQSGLIPHDAPVIPIALVFEIDQRAYVRLPATDASPVTLCIVPQAYLGYTTAMRGGDQYYKKVMTGRGATVGEKYSYDRGFPGDSSFQSFRQPNGDAIVRGLAGMWEDAVKSNVVGPADCLRGFRQILLGLD